MKRSDTDRRSPDGERRSQSEDEAEDKQSSAEIHNADDFREIFQPKHAICRWSSDITHDTQAVQATPLLCRLLPQSHTAAQITDEHV